MRAESVHMKYKKEFTKRRGVKAVTGLLFPRRCPVCDKPVPVGEGLICRACEEGLAVIKPPYCLRCGKALIRREEYCRDCAVKTHIYKRGRALFSYASVSESIYRFKYGGREEYAAYYGAKMAEGLGDFVRKIKPDFLLPVPLSKERMRMRGYNQAALLAGAMGAALRVPVRENCAKRIKNTQPQKDLNEKQRQNNLKRAFKIVPNDVKLKTIIIVDDIYTTGSTVDALAAALLDAGAKEVYFIALSAGSMR